MLTVRHLDSGGCRLSRLDEVLAAVAPAAIAAPRDPHDEHRHDPVVPEPSTEPSTEPATEGDTDAGPSTSTDPLLSTDRDDGWFWVDVSEPTEVEERVLLQLGVHQLLEEDMRSDRHLPKVELSGEQLLMVVHALRVDDQGEDHEVATSEVDVLMSPRLLVTWHRRLVPSVAALGDHLDRSPGASPERPIMLLQSMLDTITDVLIPFVDHFERRLDIIEEDLLSTPTEATRDDLYRLQRDVIQLRRVVVPQAEVMRRASRELQPLVASGQVEESDLPRFRDIYDHLYRMQELSESYSKLLDSALDTYRAAQDDELNDMLRVLTLVSALLLPISVLAGIWGTNFANLPGATTSVGFWIMNACFLALMGSMGLWFRARGWIGGQADREASDRRARLSDSLDVPVLGTILKVPVAGARTLGRGTKRLFRH